MPALSDSAVSGPPLEPVQMRWEGWAAVKGRPANQLTLSTLMTGLIM